MIQFSGSLKSSAQLTLWIQLWWNILRLPAVNTLDCSLLRCLESSMEYSVGKTNTSSPNNYSRNQHNLKRFVRFGKVSENKSVLFDIIRFGDGAQLGETRVYTFLMFLTLCMTPGTARYSSLGWDEQNAAKTSSWFKKPRHVCKNCLHSVVFSSWLWSAVCWQTHVLLD